MRVFVVLSCLVCLAVPVWAGSPLEEANCEAGDAIACNEWGRDLELGNGVAQDMARAQQMYAWGCELGQPYSCTNIGLFLQDGRVGETDVARALGYLQQGCEGGDPKGCSWVAKIHRDFVGYKDAVRAVEYARIGCDMNDSSACIWVGISYEDGAGVPKDLNRAVAQYSLACDMEDGMGCYNAALVLKHKSNDALGVDRFMRTNELAKRGCGLDHIRSCETLAYSLQTGRAVAKDLKRARALYEQTCAQDSGLGCSNLSKMVRLGQGGPLDSLRGFELKRKACDLGHTNAC